MVKAFDRHAQFPVVFSLLLNGKRVAAILETIMDGGAYNIFSIRFADGYQDCFFDSGDGKIRGINEVKSKPYAIALRHDLYIFNHLTGSTRLENFPYELEGHFVNGWIIKKQTATGLVYTIYVKGRHAFDIVKKEKGWTALFQAGAPPSLPDKKLADYAFGWLKAPVPAPVVPVHVEKKEPANSLEFPIRFFYQEKNIEALGTFMDSRPWQQCRICIVKDNSAQQADIYDFFKVDNKDKVFSWVPYSGAKEKMAKAIAAALEKKFTLKNIFASN